MTLLVLSAVVILLGGLLALGLERHPRTADRAFAVALVAGAGIGAVPAVRGLSGGLPAEFTLGASLPGGPWIFGVDPLSAWFLLIVLLVGAVTGTFGIGYLGAERPHRRVGGAHALFALLQVALIGVVTARAMAPFLVAWEVMALCGYLLVVFDHQAAEVRRAGLVYLALTHVSTLALVGMFAALRVHAFDGSFLALRTGNEIATAAGTLALGLAVLGFGIKAGIVPLHFWLPGAHAAAPSHVSAVLSGVMLKMGVYGVLRVLTLVGTPPAWLGWTLGGVGLVSGVLGVLWALGERDLKRVLAYSSVENVGLILLGLGLGVLGVAWARPTLALFGFTAALLHAFNHALYKSLLFLGAGAVLRASGTRDLRALGGLGKRLPGTALAFGVGAVAIAGLPPLNGFVSEWMLVQGLVRGALGPGGQPGLVVAVAGVGLIGALAVACFTRVVGSVFLGQPRGPVPVAAEAWSQRGPLFVLALACVVVGLFPAILLRAVAAPVASLGIPESLGQGMEPGTSDGATAVSVMSLAVLILVGVLWRVRQGAIRRWSSLPDAATWGCGYTRVTPRMQYTPTSFLAPLLPLFGSLGSPPLERGPTTLETHPRDRVLTGLVEPGWRGASRWAARLRPLQQAPVARQLLLPVGTIVLLLALLYASIVGLP